MADALGFPDATDTGVQAGVTLKAYNGDLVINTPGAVISGLDIHGSVYINADNVTLINCRITSGGYWAVSVGGGGGSSGGTGCVVQNCEINGLGGTQGSAGIQGAGTFLANNIYGVENGIVFAGSNSLAQDNYIHDLQSTPEAHYDGIAAQGGLSNITIRHNTVISRPDATSAIYINNDFGPMSNVIVDNNKLSGGGYTVYSDEKAAHPGQITGVQFTNNYLVKGYYGYAAIANNTVVWQGNIDLGTGQTVTQGGTLSAPTSQIGITAFSTDSGVAGDHITNDNTLTLTGTAAANGTVKVFDGANQIGTATANSSGAWTYTTAALTNGSHSLTAKDNAGTTSIALSVTIDTTAPSAPSIVSNTINANKVTLNGTAEANSTVQVFEGSTQLGTATTNGSGTWTFTTATLTSGAHNFTAKAMDAAGNNSGASVATNVTIGTTTQAPGAPTISSFSSDSGTVGDHITNDSTLTLTGTAAANSTVKVFDGANQIGTATANGSGGWTYTTAALANGAHSLTAKAMDAAGNASTASAALAVTVDTVAPAAPVFVGDKISSADQVTLNGTAEANSAVKVFEGTTLLGTTTTNSTGDWIFTTQSLAPGAHEFMTTATDAAGNASGLSLPLDPVIGPTTPSTSGFPDATNTGVPAGVTLKVYNGNLVISTPGAVIEGLDIHGNVTITANNVTLKNCKVTSSEFWTVGITKGVTGVVVEDCEINGLGATSNSRGIAGQGTFLRNNIYNVENGLNIQGDNSLIQDNYIHDLNASGAAHYDGIQLEGGFNNTTVRHNTVISRSDATAAVYINNDFGAINGIVVDNNKLSGGMFTVYSDEKAGGAQITGVQFINNYLAKGYYGYAFVANNTVVWQGNIDTPTGQTVTQGGTLSAPTSQIGITAFSTDSGVAGDHITNDNTLTLTGTAAANGTVKVFDGANQIGTATANSSGAWTYTTAALTNGSHSLTAKDNAGTTSIALSVTIDTTAPSAPSIVSNTINANKVTLNGTAEANSTVQVFEGSTQLGTATTNGSGTWTFTTATLTSGAHNFTAKAMDAAGNNSGASVATNVTIGTTTQAPGAPTITSFSPDTGIVGDGITDPAVLTLTGTAVANSTVNVYDGAKLLGTTTANGSGAWSFVTAALPDGLHKFTATDTVSGTTSATSSTLNVTIDTVAPVAPSIASFSTDSGKVGDRITNDATLTLTGTAEANSTVTVYDGAKLLGSAVTDGSGAWTYMPAALANGAHSLTATASDAAANTGAASAALSVTIDTTAPVAPVIASFSNDTGTVGDHITNDSTLTLTGTAEANSTVNVYDSAKLLGSAVANGSGAWTYTTAALANGAHNLTATATDAAGNIGASAALSVTIDTTAPGAPAAPGEPAAPVIASFSTDTGTVGDHISNDSTLTLTGTAVANSTVKVFDGAKVLGNATVDGGGHWSFTTGALADGMHSLTATDTNGAGTSAASNALAITVDTIAPASPVLLANVHVGSYVFMFGTSEPNSTVSIFDDANGKLVGTALTAATGVFNFTSFSNTATNFDLTVTDKAGNIGGSNPNSFNNFAGVLADAAQHGPDVVAPAGAADPTTSILKNDIHIV